MRNLLNTLYITSPDRYLSLDGENVVIIADKKEIARVPLHNLQSIVTFGYQGASPALMAACAKRAVSLNFLRESGRFLASVEGMPQGNVLLRKEQYRISDDIIRSAQIAQSMIIGKLHNSKWVLERATRDHPLQVDVEKIKYVTGNISDAIKQLTNGEENLETIRGIEGNVASQYFSVVDNLILVNKDVFYLNGRIKRPPLDNVNALLSFLYTILANDCASALRSVGFDPYVGFLHRDRPGRASLALDLMEELRAVCVDRLVFSMINLRRVDEKDFIKKENGAVIMTEDGRKKVISFWQEKKQETIKHPFLSEKIPWGIVPFVQSQLLSRFARRDIDAYPVFLWK